MSKVITVKVREGETFESALRRFNKKIKQEAVLSELRRREAFTSPSEERRRAVLSAIKRRLKEQLGPVEKKPTRNTRGGPGGSRGGPGGRP